MLYALHPHTRKRKRVGVNRIEQILTSCFWYSWTSTQLYSTHHSSDLFSFI